MRANLSARVSMPTRPGVMLGTVTLGITFVFTTFDRTYRLWFFWSPMTNSFLFRLWFQLRPNWMTVSGPAFVMGLAQTSGNGVVPASRNRTGCRLHLGTIRSWWWFFGPVAFQIPIQVMRITQATGMRQLTTSHGRTSGVMFKAPAAMGRWIIAQKAFGPGGGHLPPSRWPAHGDPLGRRWFVPWLISPEDGSDKSDQHKPCSAEH